jgi:hypothetical protein
MVNIYNNSGLVVMVTNNLISLILSRVGYRDLGIYFSGPLKSDSIPICGDGYKPRSLKFRLRANVETLYSVQ